MIEKQIIDHVKVNRIQPGNTEKIPGQFYATLMVADQECDFFVDGVQVETVQNAVLFIHKNFHWQLKRRGKHPCSGFVLYLSEQILNEPMLSKLQINDVRILHSDQIHHAQLSPIIEGRILSIIEMIDELLTTGLDHREAAILSLINTFFVYCDGKCNIKRELGQRNSKASLVYRFKKLINTHIMELHDVKEYCERLHVSPSYLNESVQEVLGINAKNLILEQLIIRIRKNLKFSEKSVKEISFDLGFSSPEYFSSFCKTHLGQSPSSYRRS
ncbi:AraC-type DNA-binding protein [Algoriphagus hitonicola]|uniref:AraC-type DNA-binding protein n=2 Tax=Algoriphagus hitonicola TaxID=435880 RepID=A0A1I2NHT6_9BACT|nr:helix-turn-helix domain-containing protein [Algoriphagus hitonicola]SFG02600.1 AraC-type DNA-binding protein [Algoriphagus hitonicola]